MVKDIYKADTFVFKGFFPTDHLQAKCKTLYYMVEKQSPDSSARVASITKRGNNYEAKLKIVSGSCNFEISTKDQEPIESVDKLYEQFVNQILNWKKHRDLFY